MEAIAMVVIAIILGEILWKLLGDDWAIGLLILIIALVVIG